MAAKGIVATGHEETAKAMVAILEAGGNAFDAVIAGFFTACIAEPVLASLGGGGFLLAQPKNNKAALYDFFAHTPASKRPVSELDFYPIHANFGPTTQVFHIGMGAIAVPGTVKGMFRIHRELGTLPLTAIIEPAITLGREGVRINKLQSFIFDIIGPIFLNSESARLIYADPDQQNVLLQQGQLLTNPDLADTIESLALEGDGLFYRGAIANRIISHCNDGGGHLTYKDLKSYRVYKRRPLSFHYRGAELLTNPPPSFGGTLIAFALKLLEHTDIGSMGFGTGTYLELLANTMAMANLARREDVFSEGPDAQTAHKLLGKSWLRRYRKLIESRTISTHGTTQISVIDTMGNLASMTVSNGEGCGHIVSGTGTMLNNMLGEEDINPGDFHQWRPAQRLASMMSPTMIRTTDGRTIVTGSGGSNRIRTAILQVILNLVDFTMSAGEAVTAPRIHYEDDQLDMEPGFEASAIETLSQHFPNYKTWDAINLFFGGAHTVMHDGNNNQLSGAGDPRRGGVCMHAH